MSSKAGPLQAPSPGSVRPAWPGGRRLACNGTRHGSKHQRTKHQRTSGAVPIRAGPGWVGDLGGLLGWSLPLHHRCLRVLEAHLDSEEVREVPREWAGGAACPGRQRGHAAPQVPGMRGLFPLAVVASVLRSHLAPRQRRAPAAAPGADQRAVPRASAAPSQRGPRGGGIGGRVGRAAEERERRGSEERRRLKRHRCKECPHSPCTPSPPLSSPS